MSADSTKKTIIVALGVCLVCSVFVSSATVVLSPIQKQNKKLDKIENVLEVSDIDFTPEDAEQLFEEKVIPSIVDLKSGKILDKSQYTDELNPTAFDIKSLSESAKYGTSISPDKDMPNIKRRPKYMLIYKILSPDKKVGKYILPVFGKGLWSTMYGFLAIDSDLKTIKGITFYDQGETPGLGGEVENPNWKALWKGKKAFNSSDEEVLTVIKGKVDKNDPNKNQKIDGLSGATLTTRGVNNLVKYWLGANGEGYAAFFDNLRKESANEKI